VIGKGGMTIKNITHESMVSMDVKEISKTESTVTIEGLEECIQHAITMIQNITGLKIESGNESNDTLITTPDLESISLTGNKIAEVLFFTGQQPNDVNFKRFLRFLFSATTTLDICVFTITDDDISREIIERFRSGIAVRIITDDDQCKTLGSDIEKLHDIGIPIRIDNSGACMHHKFAVIDDVCIINGSFNWTKQARTLNCENTLITNEMELVQPFIDHFNMLWHTFENNVYVKK